jgi:hypothetical protein
VGAAELLPAGAGLVAAALPAEAVVPVATAVAALPVVVPVATAVAALPAGAGLVVTAVAVVPVATEAAAASQEASAESESGGDPNSFPWDRSNLQQG